MTIEIAPPIAPVKAPSVNDASAAKEKTGGPEKPQADDPAGFLAILASLGEAPPVDVPLANVAVPGDNMLLAKEAPSDVANTAVSGVLSQDATTLLAQALQWAMPSDTSSVDATVAENGTSQLVGPDALASVSGAIGLKPDASPIGAGALGFDVGLEGAQKVNILGSQRKALKGQMDTAALQFQPGMGSAAAVMDGGHTEGRDIKFAPIDLGAKMAAPLLTESTAPLSIAMVKREEQSSVHGVSPFHSSPDVAVTASPGGWLGGAAGAAVGTAVMATSDAAAVKQSYLAEQISYWISNDVQKAEMKLDGLGDMPVEVSISMNGNQAHVAFRTDEVQARDALENASLQLKEMLQRDGVVLSGMSVGTSAGGESGAGSSQDRNGRQGGKSLTVMVEEPARVDRGVRSGSSVGRALDLFV